MKRVNLQQYFVLAETLSAVRQALAPNTLKGGALYFALFQVPTQMGAFINDDNGFSASKHAARDLVSAAQSWLDRIAPNSNFTNENFDQEYQSWAYQSVLQAVDIFKNVFQTECRDVDVYSVGQISIYNTSALVSAGDDILPPDIKANVSPETRVEFTSAAKCLAFDLPTSCGFHSLRALELVMDDYLASFGVKTSGVKSWMDYIKAAQKLIDDDKAQRKPKAKVAAMLDRMRELDRNPLMHPRDTLDEVGADQLFKLCAITATEMVREMIAFRSAEEASNQALLETVSSA
ncbi:MAG TPA: hypothetical protein VGN80_07495 [Devosiaceae bacterium]|nr:hypothetical protein [Devosiaceae bacterium]